MRRILLAFMSTVSAVVLLFGYRTSTAHPAASAATSIATAGAGTGSSTATAAPVPQSSSSTAGSSPSSTKTATSSRTVTGQTAQTRWGPVQVQITVSGSKVAAVTLLQVPSENPRDVEINDAAVPVLQQETLQAQSAHIDSVSGATYTSEGYISSLQSALDSAGL